jgi:adenosylcobinamide-GDP ribazoletransferase
VRGGTELLRGPLDAIAFLTIIPVSAGAPTPTGPGVESGLADAPVPASALAHAPAWFPLVGALIGALGGGVRSATFRLLGHDPSTVLALVAIVVLTGALHQDGLADCFDGLGVRGDRERRLSAMRDHATGAFGVLALVGWGLLLYTAVAPVNGPRGFETLVVAGALSRAAILVHGYAAPPARTDGLGASLNVGALVLLAGAGCAAVIALPVFGWAEGAIALGVAAAVAAGWTWFCRRAFGGRTGDTLGAVSALAELAVCLTLLAGA